MPLPREDTPLLLGKSPPLSSQFKTFANVFIAVAFKRTGWLMGVLLLLSVSVLTHHCMMLLVHTRRKLDSFNGGGFSKIGSFGDLGFAVCGSLGRLVVDLFIILSQAGLRHHITTLGFPFQLGLNSIKTLTHLAPLSIFADVVDLAAMAVVIVEDSMIILKQRPDFGGFSLFFYGMGVAVYSFEGVGMVLQDKDKFGKDTMDIITANLGAGLISTIVQLGLCINLFFTFPLMMNPVFEIVERRFSGGMYSAWLRWLLVLAIFCCILGFVLPALFHLLVFKEEMGSLDTAIVGLGVVLAVSGTWSSLSEIFSVKV
ncbi:hypothetical protein BRARA_A00002 [Brassica rapa]|uniref:Amino acid transporter transmembrane domain-containing protein n=1 Tax=Brassica campestris TaxID=3711 RepID=A0A398AK38_BRACM|nr:hypothetical protein BRARA_A00002 [Brassica rapa]